MAINWNLFKKQLNLVFTTMKPNSEDEAASKIADAYELSVLGATTVFQNSLISYNKPILKNNLSTAFIIAKSTNNLDLNLVASGFIGFWTAAQLSPIPPHPPTILPSPVLPPCIVTYPGDSVSLSKLLGVAFLTFPNKSTDLCINGIIMALTVHLTLISGVYNGMIPSPAGPVPSPPIPWVGII